MPATVGNLPKIACRGVVRVVRVAVAARVHPGLLIEDVDPIVTTGQPDHAVAADADVLSDAPKLRPAGPVRNGRRDSGATIDVAPRRDDPGRAVRRHVDPEGVAVDLRPARPAGMTINVVVA